jgi:hypothetical protein
MYATQQAHHQHPSHAELKQRQMQMMSSPQISAGGYNKSNQLLHLTKPGADDVQLTKT